MTKTTRRTLKALSELIGILCAGLGFEMIGTMTSNAVSHGYAVTAYVLVATGAIFGTGGLVWIVADWIIGRRRETARNPDAIKTEAMTTPAPSINEPAKRQWVGHKIKEIHRPQQIFSLERIDRGNFLAHLLRPRIVENKARAYYKSGWFGLPGSRHTDYTIIDFQVAGDTIRVKVAEPILSDKSDDPCETLALHYGFDGDDGTVGITGD